MKKESSWKHILIMVVGIVITLLVNGLLLNRLIASETTRLVVNLLVFYFVNSLFYMTMYH